MPISTPPTFKPAVGPITLGAAGTVLTSNGLGASTPPTFQAAGAGTGSFLGARLAYASPAGGAVAAAPVGFSSAVGRLIVTLAGGNATWVSLTAGADGQILEVRNADAANTLTLPAASFLGITGLDLNVGPGNRTVLYYDATDASWEFLTP